MGRRPEKAKAPARAARRGGRASKATSAQRPPQPLLALRILEGALPLRPAPHERAWMDATPHRMAYRCLPLVLANQMGWELLSPARFTALWSGGPRPADTRLAFEGRPSPLVQSRFGDGIITVTPGYLFRTPPGTNLWVRGPVNAPRDGASALEGVVETDWSPYTFTCNWKLTRPGLAVTFEAGEPIAHILPVPRGLLRGFAPRIEPLAAHPEVARGYEAWLHARTEAARRLAASPDAPLPQEIWDLGYLRGVDRDGMPFPDHEMRLGLPGFGEG